MYFAQAASYAIDSGILLLYYFAGTTVFATSVVYLTCGAAVTACAIALSEIHFNDQFRDHYLTVPQCMCGMTVQLAAVSLAPEVGYYFLCINFIILGFGALRMSAWQTALVWTYSTTGLAMTILLTNKPIAMPMSNWAERALVLACFVTVLGRCASMGLYGSTMREMLYKRGNELKGVESAEQLQRLREEGCTEAQGYLFSRPKPLEEVADLIRNGGAVAAA